jgi:hypothetical protein
MTIDPRSEGWSGIDLQSLREKSVSEFGAGPVDRAAELTTAALAEPEGIFAPPASQAGKR